MGRLKKKHYKFMASDASVLYLHVLYRMHHGPLLLFMILFKKQKTNENLPGNLLHQIVWHMFAERSPAATESRLQFPALTLPAREFPWLTFYLL